MVRGLDIVFVDTETDGLDYTKVHCIVVKKLGEKTQLFLDVDKFKRWADDNTNMNTVWVGHNMCGFDYWVINEMTGVTIRRHQCYDTQVMSKLLNYRKYFTHSLKELAEDVGSWKGEYDGGWDEYTPAMGTYCVQDVVALEQIFLNQDNDKWDTDYARVEHDMAFICRQMQQDGFKFNAAKAEDLLASVTAEMDTLERAMRTEWPAALVQDRRIKFRTTKDGAEYATVTKAKASSDKWVVDGDELILYKYKDFNPGSPRDRIDKLWDAGWKPHEKTEGHKKWERNKT